MNKLENFTVSNRFVISLKWYTIFLKLLFFYLKSATRPDLIKDASISRVWYKKDDKWWVPKAEIRIAFESYVLFTVK